MRRFVPLLLLSLVLSQLISVQASAASNRWAVASPTVNCAPDPSSTDPVRNGVCSASGKYFCGKPLDPNTGDCQIQNPTFSGISTRDAFNQAVSAATKSCANAHQAALKGCEGPFDFKQGNTDLAKGIQESCKQLQDQTEIATKVNAEVAGSCNGNKLRCDLYCAEAVKRIKEAAAGCAECQQDINTPVGAFKALEDKGKACQAFNSDKVVAQAKESFGGSNASKLCAKEAVSDKQAGDKPTSTDSTANTTSDSKSSSSGMNPQMLAGLAQMAMGLLMQPPAEEPTAEPVNPALDQVDCSVNPNLAGCSAMTPQGSDSWNKGTAAIEAGSAQTSSGGFDVGDTNDMQPASMDPAAALTAGTPPTVGAVPNGGGAMPGGGGGGTASLGGNGAVPGGPGPGSNTDVLHGMTSAGGMAAMAANMNMKNGESSGGYTYGQGGYGQQESGLDLSQFLPGGKQDPTRKLAGASGTAMSFQIQSKDVNIWSRISERIRARCSQGLLRDCIP